MLTRCSHPLRLKLCAFASLREIYLVLAICLGAPDRAASWPRV